MDWNLPIDQLPEEIRYEDLPPLAKALVSRNMNLRRKLAESEQRLWKCTNLDQLSELELLNDRLETENQELKAELQALLNATKGQK
jgi:hypothetical protein